MDLARMEPETFFIFQFLCSVKNDGQDRAVRGLGDMEEALFKRLYFDPGRTRSFWKDQEAGFIFLEKPAAFVDGSISGFPVRAVDRQITGHSHGPPEKRISEKEVRGEKFIVNVQNSGQNRDIHGTFVVGDDQIALPGIQVFSALHMDPGAGQDRDHGQIPARHGVRILSRWSEELPRCHQKISERQNKDRPKDEV